MFADSLKVPVWIASGSVVSGVTRYGVPTRYMLNCRMTTSAAYLAAFGPNYVDYRRAVAPNELVENIKELDRAWIGTTPSTPTDVLAKDANFYVLSASLGVGGVAQLMFKKLSKDA